MFQKITPKEINENVFSLIDDTWMLITAGKESNCNTMTASWGGLGILWGAPSATCYIRPQRYTKKFVDEHEFFTLCFFDETYRKELNLCGTKSGRDTDKIKECGFTVKSADCGAPFFEEAKLVLVCKKRYFQDFDEKNIPDDAKNSFYPEKDFHTMYIGEIIEVLQK